MANTVDLQVLGVEHRVQEEVEHHLRRIVTEVEHHHQGVELLHLKEVVIENKFFICLFLKI